LGYTRKTAYVVRVANQVSWGRGGSEGEDDAGKIRIRNRNRIRNEERQGTRLVRFSCWCPKVMAAIGRLPDTLADRCIVVRMQRKTVGESCERLRNLEAGDLRRRCARFVLDHGEAITAARPAVPEGLHDRAGDIWEPLLALADLAGGGWPERARAAATGLTVTAQENNPIASLLLDLLLLFVGGNFEKLQSRTLVEGLNAKEDRPWMALRTGNKIDELWLSRQLRPYGVRPKMLWMEGRTARGYCKEDFGEVFRRYIPQSELESLRAAAGEAAAPATRPLNPEH
jgi:putative DNA primase/helicase